MLIPHRHLLLVVGLWLAGSFVAIWLPPALEIWQSAGLALLILGLGDAWSAIRLGNPIVLERKMAQVWPVGVEQTIRLRLMLRDGSDGWGSVRGQIYDRHPDDFAARTLPLAFKATPGEWVETAYHLQPDERGDHTFRPAHIRIDSPLRLWQTQHEVGDTETVRVFPNFARITQYALLATDNRLAQIGVLRRRRRGEGSDFDQLREYRRDDSPRHIDWKATARLRKPIVREFQDERDQQIVFLLDCGQRMRSRDDALSHFDHTLNAMLLLSYVALRQGDAVGFGTFAHADPRFFAPRKSLATVQMLLNATYDLQPTLHTPDYLAASDLLVRRLRKRSLVVLLTNLRDEDDSTLQPALAQLRRHHLMLVASLRETGLERLRHTSVGDFDEALGYAAAMDYALARQKQQARLRAQGISVLDTQAAQLPVALVNRYWDIKRSGLF
ncbi:DUF58 domain-containing protein [Propionivibrio limicola]|uniref:DUF58 domain-containing protein n=1 Tax=Propionivibrio limicola TaxID=167645 RepID=UPI001B87C87D|nr:DUF58 domain-containing protein [Propionivibrio limicola]